MPIKDIHSLRTHLQWAIELEHATIPPYLTALYSIKEGSNKEATGVILSVVMEEMLHMTLAANILNAVGGSPQLDHPRFLPHYPCYLPHSDQAFLVSLAKFSPEAIETFMQIEKPEERDAPPEAEGYATIGQFYDALTEGLTRLCHEHGEARIFTGDPARQLGPTSFHYDAGGKIIPVTDLATAIQAMEEIKEQGEGLNHTRIWDGDRSMFHHAHREVSHFFRFEEILKGRRYHEGDTPQSGPSGRQFQVDWDAVYNFRPNVHANQFPRGSAIRAKLTAFHQTYGDLLRLMHDSFNGQPGLMASGVGTMYEVKYQALELMQMPSGDGETTVGISFEYAPPASTQAQSFVPKAVTHAATPRRIKIRPHGPYAIEGDLPIRRKSKLMSELGEALTWKQEELIKTDGACALCRCGASDAKPFCDGSHARIHFNGTETAPNNPRAERAKDYPGTRLTVQHDRTICAFATFCENKITDVWDMSAETADTRVRAQVISMIERCPSGALTYRIEPEGETIEPGLPEEIVVITDGPLWVTGGVSIERTDGQMAETRNRVTLCRCGKSKNKPFCDGTHIDIKFKG